MPAYDCLAVNCGRGIRRGQGYLMCMPHWMLVPQELRHRLDELRREQMPSKSGASLAYRVAELAAVRAVALAEEARVETAETTRARLELWNAVRDKLRAELGNRQKYFAEIRPYAYALRKLMAESACHDPIFVCTCAISFDVQQADRTARRIAAALEVADRQGHKSPSKGVRP